MTLNLQMAGYIRDMRCCHCHCGQPDAMSPAVCSKPPQAGQWHSPSEHRGPSLPPRPLFARGRGRWRDGGGDEWRLDDREEPRRRIMVCVVRDACGGGASGVHLQYLAYSTVRHAYTSGASKAAKSFRGTSSALLAAVHEQQMASRTHAALARV